MLKMKLHSSLISNTILYDESGFRSNQKTKTHNRYAQNYIDVSFIGSYPSYEEVFLKGMLASSGDFSSVGMEIEIYKSSIL